MLGHRQLRRLLLGAQILHARGLSGHTSPHFTLRISPATPETPRCSDIASYTGDSSVLGHRQLRRGLHGARTSSATPGDFSVLGHRQLRWGLLSARTSPATLGTPRRSDITSYAGDSSVFRFFMQASPAKLRTPLVVGSCYVSSVCYQATPCCSDQGADLGQQIWGLDTRMSDDVGKLLDFFSLTLLQDSFFIFQQARGLSGYTSPSCECSALLLIYPPY